jgi:hypothetical protein
MVGSLVCVAVVVPARVASAQPATSAQGSGSNNVTLQKDNFILAINDCHQLALLNIQTSDIDAQAARTNAEIGCNHDQTCIQKAAATYAAQKNGFDIQKNNADALQAKEMLQLNYMFKGGTTIEVSLDTIPTKVQPMLRLPVGQWDCGDLASELDPNAS